MNRPLGRLFLSFGIDLQTNLLATQKIDSRVSFKFSKRRFEIKTGRPPYSLEHRRPAPVWLCDRLLQSRHSRRLVPLDKKEIGSFHTRSRFCYRRSGKEAFQADRRYKAGKAAKADAGNWSSSRPDHPTGTQRAWYLGSIYPSGTNVLTPQANQRGRCSSPAPPTYPTSFLLPRVRLSLK